jgi:hypothetical protein
MKHKTFYTVETVQKSNRKIVGGGTIHTPNTHMHNCLLSPGMVQAPQ